MKALQKDYDELLEWCTQLVHSEFDASMGKLKVHAAERAMQLDETSDGREIHNDIEHSRLLTSLLELNSRMTIQLETQVGCILFSFFF